jgi:hypothetical protein
MVPVGLGKANYLKNNPKRAAKPQSETVRKKILSAFFSPFIPINKKISEMEAFLFHLLPSFTTPYPTPWTTPTYRW